MKALLMLLIIPALHLGLIQTADTLWGDPGQLAATRAQALSDQEAILQRLAELSDETQRFAVDPKHLWQAESAGDALREVQMRTTEIADAAGVPILSLNAEPERDLGEFRKLGLRIESEADYAAIVALVAGVEAHSPSLRLEDLQIRRKPGRRAAETAPEFYLNGLITALVAVAE